MSGRLFADHLEQTKSANHVDRVELLEETGERLDACAERLKKQQLKQLRQPHDEFAGRQSVILNLQSAFRFGSQQRQALSGIDINFG